MKADLHIHTCLSPCGDLDMTPKKIVAEARRKNLAMIAICDHHTAGNVPAVARAAGGKKLCVIPGMEISTEEEVHVIGLFEDIDSVMKLEQLMYEHLPSEENDEGAFGMQVISNEHDEVEGFNKKFLIGSVALPLSRVVDEIHALGGMAVAAHIDRESYSVIQQLGFIPEDLEFDALEVSANLSLQSARETYKAYKGYAFITSSDAHFIRDVGKATTRFLVKEASFKELCLALSGREERGIQVDPE